MKRKLYTTLALLFVLAFQLSAQQTPSRYLIKFRNKGNSTFSLSNPLSFLSARSVARRTKYNISIDSTDLPVTQRYIDSLQSIPTVVVLNPSKWLNQVSIQITDTAATNMALVFSRISSFPFVLTAAPIALRSSTSTKDKVEQTSEQLAASGKENGVLADVFNYGSSQFQVKMHNGHFLHNIGLRGEGMVIGMLDAGFLNYLTVKAFDSVRANNQILGTWDFVKREASVNEDDAHGMQCFSIIAANIPGQFVGTAPKASFYLFRSEEAATEYQIEEHNWVCAAEKVDSSGGDVISSSLGYNVFDAPLTSQSHTYADMNGNTTIAAIGADLAAKKGILVVNAAGNEGNKAWGKIITPADGDSVLAVGAVNTSGWAAAFTSRGPSSDGQVKPDVASLGVGTTLQLSNNVVGTGNGTSFACPNMAGLATALWQGFPEFNNMKIINAIRRSGSRALNPNDSIGYGIPDMKKALMSLTIDFSTATSSTNSCSATISWTTKETKDMKFEIERKLPGQSNYVKIGELFGAGNSFSTQNHAFNDNVTAISGAISYRIRQIVDTSVAGFYADYIDTVSVNGCLLSAVPDVNAAGFGMMLTPNPSRGQVRLAITTVTPQSNIIVRIVNNKGQVISNSRKSQGSGTSTYDLELGKVPAGKYYVTVYTGGKLVGTKELIKL
jgi:serine protease AprX